MGVSLDGYIAGPDGKFDWAAPDEELHRFHNEQTRSWARTSWTAALRDDDLLGDRQENPAAHEIELEFARIWQALPKIVFSSTLQEVEGNQAGRGRLAEEVARLKEARQGPRGGRCRAGREAVRLGLVDEYRLFINPVVVGGGTPFFPTSRSRKDLELVEMRTFGSRVVYVRYRRA